MSDRKRTIAHPAAAGTPYSPDLAPEVEQRQSPSALQQDKLLDLASPTTTPARMAHASPARAQCIGVEEATIRVDQGVAIYADPGRLANASLGVILNEPQPFGKPQGLAMVATGFAMIER